MNIIQRFEKFDQIKVGIILGLLAPLVTLTIVYLHTFDGYTISEFILFLKKMRIISKLFSLCVLPNLGVFFLFIWSNFLRGAKGTLLATFIIAIIIVIIQFMTVGL